MIDVDAVVSSVVALLRGEWPAVGDGEPPDVEDGKPYAWVTPQPGPGTGAHMGGGQPHQYVRVRVSSAAVEPPTGANVARRQATMLADRLRSTMLTGPMPPAVAGRVHDGHAPVVEPGAYTVHDDFLLYVPAASPDD